MKYISAESASVFAIRFWIKKSRGALEAATALGRQHNFRAGRLTSHEVSYGRYHSTSSRTLNSSFQRWSPTVLWHQSSKMPSSVMRE